MLKIGDVVGGMELTPELLEDLRTEQGKKDAIDLLAEEQRKALCVLHGDIYDPDDGFTSKEIRKRKQKRARILTLFELIFEDDFPAIKEMYPEVFSLRTSRILSPIRSYHYKQPIGTPWLEIVEL